MGPGQMYCTIKGIGRHVGHRLWMAHEMLRNLKQCYWNVTESSSLKTMSHFLYLMYRRAKNTSIHNTGRNVMYLNWISNLYEVRAYEINYIIRKTNVSLLLMTVLYVSLFLIGRQHGASWGLMAWLPSVSQTVGQGWSWRSRQEQGTAIQMWIC
jgi:hypothetical protein